jgi:hypothetical protein
MPQAEPTLGDLFPLSEEELSQKLTSAMASEHGGSLGWSAPVRRMVVEDVARRFGELLDVRLADIMAGAWCKYSSLLKYTDPRQHPPDESIVVPLVEHDIDSRHAPAIEVLMNNTPVMKLTFAVNLTLTLKTAVVRIQNARIREIRPGEVLAKGKIAFGPAVIAERKSGTLTLPGSIDLGEGIAIRPLSQRATS